MLRTPDPMLTLARLVGLQNAYLAKAVTESGMTTPVSFEVRSMLAVPLPTARTG